MVIYKITNKINGKVYIGKTIHTIEKRWDKHVKMASKKVNRRLYDAMNCYGYKNFLVEKIDDCHSLEHLNEREMYWIAHYESFIDPNKGYNMTPGGDGGLMAPEVYIRIGPKISKARTGHIVTAETRALISKSRTGMKHTEETKRKLSDIHIALGTRPPITHRFGKDAPMFGKIHSKESRAKMSAARAGKTWDDIYSAETVKILKENNRKNFLGTNNPQYKEVDKELLMQYIKEGLDNEQIGKRFNCSRVTIISKIKQYFNKTPSELRKEIFGTITPQTKFGDYKMVDFKLLLYYIKKGKTQNEIAELFSVSGPTISNKIYKRYNLSFTELKQRIEEYIDNEKISINSKNN